MDGAARGRQAAPRPARRGGRPAPHLQPRAPQRARPRDPRRDRRDAAAARPRDRDPLRPDHRRAAGLLRRLRHRRDPRRDLRARRRGARRPPLPRRDGGDRRPPLADRGRDQRPLPRRRPRAGDHLRPADLRRRRQARHAAGEARPRSTATPGCASSSTRSAWPRTKELFLTGRNFEAARAERDRPRQRGRRRRPSWRRRRSSWRPRSPPTRRSRCGATRARSTCSTPHPVLSDAAGGGPDRPARVVLRLGGPARGDRAPSPRSASPSGRAGERKGAHGSLAKSDPTMAALIERVGKIDLATRLARRSEERPDDAYGALLRAIVGQQLSTKAARTIYLRVLDLFDGATPSPEQLLEAERSGPARRRPLRPQGRVHPRPRLARDQRRARARPPRRAQRRGGDRGDRRRARARPLDRGDVPALPPRAPRRPLRRRPRHPQGGADRVRAGGDADAGSRCWRSASPGARTAASPPSTSGSRWPPFPEPEPRADARRLSPQRDPPSWPTMPVCAFASGSASPRSSLIAAGSVAAALIVRADDSDDFHDSQRDEALRAAHQAEAAGPPFGRPAFQRRRLLPGRGYTSTATSSTSSPTRCWTQGALTATAFIQRVPDVRAGRLRTRATAPRSSNASRRTARAERAPAPVYLPGHLRVSRARTVARCRLRPRRRSRRGRRTCVGPRDSGEPGGDRRR